MRDAGEFDEFYRASARGVVAHLYAMTGDWMEAQDCAQEAFGRAWQKWERLSDYEDPAGWVRTVGYRIAVSRWRRSTSALRAWRRHGAPADESAPSPDTVALVTALRHIPEAQREAIVLHHLGGLSVDEVAARTGVPSGTVKARLSRGRAALAPLLTERDAGADPFGGETEVVPGG